MKKIFFLFLISYSLLLSSTATAQDNDLGVKDIVVVKAYNPVLAESFKISNSPESDTTSSVPRALQYNITPKKIETNYEAGVIKAVKLKDEPISKLYKNLVKLGIGNYSTYYGELFMNSLRSKTGSLGLHLKHFSASPTLTDAGDGSFSDNEAGVYGKYFFENSTFTGEAAYTRNVVHYYGYNSADPLLHLVLNPDNTKQRFSNFAMNFGLGSTLISKGDLDYDLRFHFNSISDLYSVTEPDLMIGGTIGKPVDGNYFSINSSLDFFKKSNSSIEKLYVNPLNHNLSRNIITIQPQVKIDKDRAQLVFGLGLGIESNLSTTLHVFPKAEISLPIAEHVLTAFAGVDGNIQKNSFKTITDENPFAISSLIPLNTINKLILKGGLKGNFSNAISFTASVNYSQVKDMQFFYAVSDSISPNKFDILYDNTNVLNLHAELSYLHSEKLNISLHVDLFKYTPDLLQNAWYKPESIVSLVAKYNLRDKIIADFSLFAHGSQYAANNIAANQFIVTEKINGYADANFGLEYRYSKILSLYLHFNNLGFSRYYEWEKYPSEKFNLLGGMTYAF